MHSLEMAMRHASLAIRAAMLLGLALPVMAETSGDLPKWVPEATVLPEDFTVVRETEVGSTNRLLVLELHDNVEGLIERWQAALETAGYQVETPEAAMDQERITFSGQGIRTGQIVALPGTAEGATLIQIDATLE